MTEPRLLLVVSNDFGELSSALDFLRGWASNSSLLLPRRLYDINANCLEHPVKPYNTLGDIFTAIDDQKPDVVLLFSGYLYAINNLITLSEHENLLAGLATRRLPVISTDPFFGLLNGPDPAPFNKEHPAELTLTMHFGRIATSMQDVAHLYLGPADTLNGQRKFSVFNPTLIDSQQQAANRRLRLSQRLGLDPARERWLFVLSAEDHAVQVARMGRARFETMLVQRLADAVRASRQPVLIAPTACVDALKRNHTEIAGLVALPFCRQDDFANLVRDAEQAFYWNMLSHSVLARLANRMPVCFFDAGHLSHVVPALLPLAIASFFAGVCPTMHSPLDALDAEQLASDGWDQIKTLALAVARLHACLTPQDVVTHVMNNASTKRA